MKYEIHLSNRLNLIFRMKLDETGMLYLLMSTVDDENVIETFFNSIQDLKYIKINLHHLIILYVFFKSQRLHLKQHSRFLKNINV